MYVFFYNIDQSHVEGFISNSTAEKYTTNLLYCIFKDSLYTLLLTS